MARRLPDVVSNLPTQRNFDALLAFIDDLQNQIDAIGGGPGGSVAAYDELIGDGAATSYDVAHGLSSELIDVSVYEDATGDEVGCPVTILDDDTVRVFVTPAPATDSLRVVVIG